MGVWGRLTSVFGKHESNGSGMRRGMAGLAPEEPILVKWPPATRGDSPRNRADAADPDSPAAPDSEQQESPPSPGSTPTASTPSAPNPAAQHAAAHDIVTPPSSRKPTREELIGELRHNYAEVIDLVRKVNTHLDQQTGRLEHQDRRADRIVELMERLPDAVAVLPEIRDQNARLVELSGRMVEAITDLAAATREGQRSIETAFTEQTRLGRESAEKAEALLSRSAESQDRAVASLGDLGQNLGASSDRLASMLNQFHARAGEREAKLAEMVSRGQRWLILAIVLCVSAVVVAGVAVVLLLI